MRVEEPMPVAEPMDLRRSSPFCVVVIPAYNEAESLPVVLQNFPPSAAGISLVPLVVADGCDDGTTDVARSMGVAVISQHPRQGSGAAVRAGFRAALEAGATVVATLDADGQHDPKEIERLLAPVVEGRVDIAQGSRVLGGIADLPRLRRLGIRFYSRALNLLVGTRITDPSTGFRAMTADTARRIPITENQFYVPQLIVAAARNGLSIVEVPTTGRRRYAGQSKKPASFGYAWGFTRSLLRSRFGRRPPG